MTLPPLLRMHMIGEVVLKQVMLSSWIRTIKKMPVQKVDQLAMLDQIISTLSAGAKMSLFQPTSMSQTTN
jgi:hypothetical protein